LILSGLFFHKNWKSSDWITDVYLLECQAWKPNKQFEIILGFSQSSTVQTEKVKAKDKLQVLSQDYPASCRVLPFMANTIIGNKGSQDFHRFIGAG